MRKVITSIKTLPSDLYRRAVDSGVMIASTPGDRETLIRIEGDPAGVACLIADALGKLAKYNPGALRANVFAACKAVEDEIRELDYEDQKVSKLDEFRLNK